MRHGRGVQLTEIGRQLLDHCHGILHLVAKAKEDLAARRDEPVGSSIPVILDLVAAGMGHAALAEDAIRPYQHLKRLAVTPIVQPGIKYTLCLVTPAQRRATPLRHGTAALVEQLARGA